MKALPLQLKKEVGREKILWMRHLYVWIDKANHSQNQPGCKQEDQPGTDKKKTHKKYTVWRRNRKSKKS
jgi:hypothetical protein